ncbi:glutathione S-transferase family protein [Variovorax dokdonensis]|uniref:Glutathione S-transferase family protein n=1 Tax=Variovorax dokdonensis TaxID=344883 RepID=A0ABT7N6B0_9BURK|nr:glutathione S-transferase family protein [Variovorax dokdonensis]MDM0043415.1 glutathione S-transferase family protein [Variovorax dokdonensis]
MYKLYGFAQSGNTFKVAMMLQALRQPWEPVHVPFGEFVGGLTRTDAWREANNPMGEVPILQDEDGRRMSQSGVILTRLARRHGAFGGATEEEQDEALRWMFFDNHKFTSFLATWRFMKSFAPVAPDPALEKFLRGRVEGAFAVVEKHLASREWMVGTQPTIADISLAGYLYYPPEESGYDIGRDYPAMARWLDRLQQNLPGWKPPYELLPGERIAPKR